MITVKFRLGGQTLYGVLVGYDAITRQRTVQYRNQNAVQSFAILRKDTPIVYVSYTPDHSVQRTGTLVNQQAA